MKEDELKKIAKLIMSIDHVGVQTDSVISCNGMEEVISILDSMDKESAIRLLIHIIHVQQLQLLDAEIKYNNDNPFKDMVDFKHIGQYITNYTN